MSELATNNPPSPQPKLIQVHRRASILRLARGVAGVKGLYGIDLTAGCFSGCAFCFLKETARFPGPDRILFDPDIIRRVASEIDEAEIPVRRVVLSPASEPLPTITSIRETALALIRLLFERGIEVYMMTRERVTSDFVEVLKTQPRLSRVAICLNTLDRTISRSLEPRAPLGSTRLRGARRLIDAGIAVEVRLEPVIPFLTDSTEVLRPLFDKLSRIGIDQVTVQHLFTTPAIQRSTRERLQVLGVADRIDDAFDQGPVISLGEVGRVKLLKAEIRRQSMAQIMAIAAEFGLTAHTSTAQNPDLPASNRDRPKVLPTSSQEAMRGSRRKLKSRFVPLIRTEPDRKSALTDVESDSNQLGESEAARVRASPV